MGRRTGTIVALAMSLLALGGCEAITDPDPLEEFQWLAVEDPNQVTEGIDAAPFFGSINLLGQMLTPSLCFSLDPAFSRSGSTLTMHVTARPSNSPSCSQAPGGYQYTAVLRHLDAGTYTLNVIHSVPGSADKSYTTTVTL